MSESCCQVAGNDTTPGQCPVNGVVGKPVEWLTVAALVSSSVPRRQTLWLCRDPDCKVVYFGDQGTTLRVQDLNVEPGFKAENGDGLLCYCFQVRGDDIETELRESGVTTVVERITAEVKAGNCACEVRNPTGKCCLGELRAGVNEIRKRMKVSG